MSDLSLPDCRLAIKTAEVLAEMSRKATITIRNVPIEFEPEAYEEIGNFFVRKYDNGSVIVLEMLPF